MANSEYYMGRKCLSVFSRLEICGLYGYPRMQDITPELERNGWEYRHMQSRIILRR